MELWWLLLLFSIRQYVPLICCLCNQQKSALINDLASWSPHALINYPEKATSNLTPKSGTKGGMK